MVSPSIPVFRLVVSYGSEGVGMQQTTAARLLVVVDAATEVIRRDVTKVLADLHRRLVVRRDELEIVRSGDVGRQKYVLVTAIFTYNCLWRQKHALPNVYIKDAPFVIIFEFQLALYALSESNNIRPIYLVSKQKSRLTIGPTVCNTHIYGCRHSLLADHAANQ